MSARRREAPGRDVPVLYRGTAAAAVRSRAAAVKLFCLECVGYLREDVRACTAHACALWRWRPYQNDREDDALTPEKPGVAALEGAQRAPVGGNTTRVAR